MDRSKEASGAVRRAAGFALAVALPIAGAGCAGTGGPPGPGPRGVVALSAWAPALQARAFAEGGSKSTDGSPRVGALGTSAAVLFDRWALTWDSATVFLPTDPDLSGGAVVAGSSTRYARACLAAGPKILEVPAAAGEPPGSAARGPPLLRLDALAGLRVHDLSVVDADLGTGRTIDFRERWADAVAGLRAEGAVVPGVAWRVQGDSAIGGSGSDHAWRACAALVLGPSEGFGIALGWEAQALDYSRGRGPDLVRLDMKSLGGPFLALEIRF